MKYRVVAADRAFTVELSPDGSQAIVTRQDGTDAITIRLVETPPGQAEELRVQGHSGAAAQIWLAREADRDMTISLEHCVVEARVETPRERLARRTRRGGVEQGLQRIRSLLPGVIRSVRCAVGDAVTAETALVTLEAMKMENELRAEFAGTIRAVHVAEGQVVHAGDVLLEVEPSDGPAPPDSSLARSS